MKKKNINRNINSESSQNLSRPNSFRDGYVTNAISETEINDFEPIYESALIYLSETDQERVQLAASLAIDIFTDSHVAQEFVENPSTYMEMHNLSYEGDLDFGIIQMALAFADDDIRQAISGHDVEGFISLCITRGLFSFPTGIENVNITEVYGLLEHAGFNMEEIGNDNDEFSASFVWAAIALVAVAVALVVIDVIEIVHHAGIAPEIDEPISLINMAELNPSPITLWAIINEDIESSQLMLNEVANEYYTIIDDYMENHFERYSSDEEFRNKVQILVKSNLIKYLMQ